MSVNLSKTIYMSVILSKNKKTIYIYLGSLTCTLLCLGSLACKLFSCFTQDHWHVNCFLVLLRITDSKKTIYMSVILSKTIYMFVILSKNKKAIYISVILIKTIYMSVILSKTRKQFTCQWSWLKQFTCQWSWVKQFKLNCFLALLRITDM
jgi:hypothetical protein